MEDEKWLSIFYYSPNSEAEPNSVHLNPAVNSDLTDQENAAEVMVRLLRLPPPVLLESLFWEKPVAM